MRTFAICAVLLVLGSCARPQVSACHSSYVDVGGVHTFYDVCGSGPPLVLLHGATMVREGWEPLVAPLAARYTLYIPERRGVGRTSDIEGPWTYDGFALETAAFMDALAIQNAKIFGLSDGGNIALILAARRPDLVEAVAVSGANFDAAGLGEFGEAVRRMNVEEFIASAPPEVQTWLEIQRRVSPDRGESLQATMGKMKEMWFNFEITDQTLQSIRARTLVMAGDRDMFTVPYTTTLWQKIPNAALCIVPEADHFWPLSRPALAAGLLTRFFDEQDADNPG